MKKFLNILTLLLFVGALQAQTYIYSAASDFTTAEANINIGLLGEEIVDSDIAKTLTGINFAGDEVKVMFDVALSAGEKTTLDGDTTGPSGGLIGDHPATEPAGETTLVLLKTVDPTANDDIGDSYGIGQHWINTSNKNIFFLVDNTLGAAVWHPVNQFSNLQRDSSQSESSTSGSSPVEKVAVSLPACDCEYMVYAYAEARQDSISSEIHVQLWSSPAGSQLAKLEIEPSDGSNWFPVIIIEDVTLSGSSKTIKLRFWDDGEDSTAYLRNAFIFAERIN